MFLKTKYLKSYFVFKNKKMSEVCTIYLEISLIFAFITLFTIYAVYEILKEKPEDTEIKIYGGIVSVITTILTIIFITFSIIHC